MNATNGTIDVFRATNWAETAIFAVQMYYIPVLVTLGSFGNILSVYIFFKTKMRRASSSWYLSALAISDTGFLMSIFVTWLNIVGISIFNRPGYCQFFVYISSLCSFLSVWFVVSFTVERFIAVRYPLQRQLMCTVVRAKMVLLGLIIVGLAVCSPVLWFSSSRKISDKHNTTFCLLAKGWENWAHGFNIADTILTFILPFTVIVILNGRIVMTVWRLARVRRSLTSNSRKCQKSGYKSQGLAGLSQTKITKMLLIVSTFFLCFNLPAYVMRVHAFLEENDNPPRTVVVIQHVCNLFFHTSFGMNFFLYCASGQNFRKIVITMICNKRRRWHSGTPRISHHGTQISPGAEAP